jgi:hypothetical protein
MMVIITNMCQLRNWFFSHQFVLLVLYYYDYFGSDTVLWLQIILFLALVYISLYLFAFFVETRIIAFEEDFEVKLNNIKIYLHLVF